MVSQLYRKGPDGLWRSPGRQSLGSSDDAERPEGPGYVRYEDLYVTGDSVTDAMNRLTDPAIVTFPEGEFLLYDYKSVTKVGNVQTGGAINCEWSLVKGMIGSGRGTLGGSTGTVFKMVPYSSTMGGTSATPSQSQGGTTQVWGIRCVGAAFDVRFENFQFVGAAQGHLHNGLYVYHPQGSMTIRNVLIAGTEGNNGAPPGETFGVHAYAGNDKQVLLEDIEFDGRREIGGEWFGGGGITTGQSIGCIVNRCKAHHNRVSSPFVFYRAFDGILNDCEWGTTDTPIITNGNRPVSCVNHEVTSGIVHNNCTYNQPTHNWGTHMTFSNAHHVINYNWPEPRSSVNGSLKVVNPTWNQVWDGNDRMFIQSWTTGVDGTTDDDSMVTPPLVVESDGVTHVPYMWAHGTSQLIN